MSYLVHHQTALNVTLLSRIELIMIFLAYLIKSNKS